MLANRNEVLQVLADRLDSTMEETATECHDHITRGVIDGQLLQNQVIIMETLKAIVIDMKDVSNIKKLP